MKLIIQSGAVKRELNGPLRICGSIEDLETLGEHILEDVRRRKCEGTTYGWTHEIPQLPQLANTPPKKWED